MRLFTVIFSLSWALLATCVAAGPWKKTDPTSAGWSAAALKAAEAYVSNQKPTAMMVVQNGKVIASWGDVKHKVNVASVRKSLLSALYGVAVYEGKISLDSTLAELGVDDKPPSLTETEKQATIRDLPQARSGVLSQIFDLVADVAIGGRSYPASAANC